MAREGDYLLYAKHIPEPGSYWDGRPYETVMVMAESAATPVRGCN